MCQQLPRLPRRGLSLNHLISCSFLFSFHIFNVCIALLRGLVNNYFAKLTFGNSRCNFFVAYVTKPHVFCDKHQGLDDEMFFNWQLVILVIDRTFRSALINHFWHRPHFRLSISSPESLRSHSGLGHWLNILRLFIIFVRLP